MVEVPQQTVAVPPPVSDLVAASEPDYYVSALMAIPPSDPYYSQQWALPVIGAPDAWRSLPSDAPKVVVAVIDSGVCMDNPDLRGRVLSIFGLAFRGGGPVGSLVAGFLVRSAGAPAVMAAYAALLTAIAAALLLRKTELRHT